MLFLVPIVGLTLDRRSAGRKKRGATVADAGWSATTFDLVRTASGAVRIDHGG